MSKVINLNTFKKQKAKAEKTALAEQNRVKFGRTKSEKNAAKQRDSKLKSHVDNHHLKSSDKSDGEQ
jgi:hypothetical protein